MLFYLASIFPTGIIFYVAARHTSKFTIKSFVVSSSGLRKSGWGTWGPQRTFEVLYLK